MQEDCLDFHFTEKFSATLEFQLTLPLVRSIPETQILMASFTVFTKPHVIVWQRREKASACRDCGCSPKFRILEIYNPAHQMVVDDILNRLHGEH